MCTYALVWCTIYTVLGSFNGFALILFDSHKGKSFKNLLIFIDSRNLHFLWISFVFSQRDIGDGNVCVCVCVCVVCVCVFVLCVSALVSVWTSECV